MIELLHLPEQSELVTWFPGQGASTSTTGWRVWTKPRGINMVSIVLISSGGGGAGGSAGAVDTALGSTGGGASSGISRYVFPAWILPDRLYVLSRCGGLGGNGASSTGAAAAGSTGTSGALSYVAIYPDTTAGNLVGISGAAAPTGGVGGATSGGAGGTAGTVALATSAPLGQMAYTQTFIAGNTGGLPGSTYNIGTGCPILGGVGGNGKAASGGGLAGGGYGTVANTLLSLGVPGGVATTGDQASSGFIHTNARYYYGGCGGGSSNTGVGGRGGDGVAWGTGGGGGGGGVNNGGRGGDGGPGLVVISCW